MGASDATTLRAVGDGSDRPRLALVPTLTVLWHPDARRVGEVAIIPSGTRLSRLEPELGPPGGSSAEPLGDPGISRKPARIRITRSGGVEIVPAESGSPLEIDGVIASGMVELAAAELARGVTIAIADRVALLLHLRTPVAAPEPTLGLVGASDALVALRRRITQVGDLDVPVLLAGPTGAGKELVARALHDLGPRVGGPFVSVNMASIPASTAASQLFGHVRGAFTGADRDHRGFFAEADGGTLFLDEIAETPPEVQAMLLRALETQTFFAVGASTATSATVRLVAASDRDLEAAAAAGHFKAPLYHRLAGYRIPVPPLCDRVDDIGRLLVAFVREELARAGEPDRLVPPVGDAAPWLAAGTVAALCRYAWPGNVRELRNIARHLVISSRGMAVAELDATVEAVLDQAPSRAEPAPGGGATPRPAMVGEAELVAALRENGWKIGATAKALGISRTSLYALMDRCPGIRKAKDISAEEIRAAIAAARGELAATAAALEVSERGLRLRITELGLDLG